MIIHWTISKRKTSEVKMFIIFFLDKQNEKVEVKLVRKPAKNQAKKTDMIICELFSCIKIK